MPVLLILALAAADPLAALRARDDTLARVGYRLATAGAPLCRPDGHPAGFVVERASQYEPGDRVRSGVGPLPTVTVVVPGSPAAAAGMRVGDRIAAIDSQPVSPEDVARAPVAYAPTSAVRAQLDMAVADGRATLVLATGTGERTVVLDVPAGCASQFQVRPSGKLNSYADGSIVQITSAVIDFTHSDAELAAVVAHELAHNILRHPQTLKAIGRPLRAVRNSEAAADRLSVYLLALAGYPFDEVMALRERIGRKIDWGILSDGTHPGWKETLALMTVEHARIVAQLANGEAVRPPPDLRAPAP